MTPRIEPWDRLKGESAKAYGAFCIYRDIPVLERSVAAAARSMGRDYSWIKEWAKKHNWLARGEAWDQHLDEVGRRAQIVAVQEMNDRQARMASGVIHKLSQRINGDEEEGVAAIDLNKLTPSDIAKMADVFGKMERIARGEETERMGIRAEIPEVKVKVAFEIQPHFPDQDNDPITLDGSNLVQELDP